MFEPLTQARREFLAKSLMDIVKLAIAAGLASGFFVAFGVPIRVALGLGILLSFVGAWFLYPPKGGH